MKLIIPMAGKGKRMRPHTLTVPKPLIEIAGKPIVERIVESVSSSCSEKITDIGFVIAPDFGKETEEKLLKLSHAVHAKGHIFYQNEPLGTAHAVYCASSILEDKIIVAFADTLFRSSFRFNPENDGVIWVKEVENPSSFGVVKTDSKGFITAFVEKPSEPVSKLAIIGIYYLKDAAKLKKEIEHLLDNNLKEKGEFQLTNALEALKNKGLAFKAETIDEWMDCGNTDITLQTHHRILEIASRQKEHLVHTHISSDSIIIPPCYVGEGATLERAVVGPYVSVGKKAVVKNTVLSHCILGEGCVIENMILNHSMVGEFAELKGSKKTLSIGAYSRGEM